MSFIRPPNRESTDGCRRGQRYSPAGDYRGNGLKSDLNEGIDNPARNRLAPVLLSHRNVLVISRDPGMGDRGAPEPANNCHLPHCLLLKPRRPRTARRTPYSVTQLADVDLQFGDGAAEGVAVHAELARRAALVAFIFLEDGQDETLLEFSPALGVKNVASVHLQNKRFQLIFHKGALFSKV